MLVLLVIFALGSSAIAQFDFEPLPSSVRTGSLPESAPLLLPPGYEQELVASYSDLKTRGLPANLFFWDMITWATPTELWQGEPRPGSNRYLFVPTETGIIPEFGIAGGGLFRSDMQTGEFVVLMESTSTVQKTADPAQFNPLDSAYGNLGPATYTPYDTILTGEGTTGGRLFEIQNPFAATRAEANVRWLSKVPAAAHEGLRFDSNQNLYFIDEFRSGSVYKYVPTAAGDLSQGQTFVLAVDAFDGDASEFWDSSTNIEEPRTGAATWQPITDMDGNAITLADPFVYVTDTGGRNAADEVNGTPYGRPEDMVITTLNNGNEAMLFTTTDEDAVYTVEFTGSTTAEVRLFVKAGVTLDALTGLPVEDGLEGFKSPDNLALSPDGKVFIIEDQGALSEDPLAPPTPGGAGGDVWSAIDADNDGVAESVARFVSLATLGAEPSGMIFDPLDPDSFLIVVQHPFSSVANFQGNSEPGQLGDAIIRVTAPKTSKLESITEVKRTSEGFSFSLPERGIFDIEFSKTMEPDSWEVIGSSATDTFEDTDSQRTSGTGFYRAVKVATQQQSPGDLGNLWCLGDSYTQCFESTTWRRQLSQDLDAAGWEVDFVGTLVSPANCETGQTFDRDHNGIAGITAEDVLANRLSGWLNAVTPDTVLLLLGANDFQEGASLPTVVKRLNAIVDQIRNDNPNVVIYLSNYGYNHTFPDSVADDSSESLLAMAADRTTTNSPLYFVDHRIGWDKSIHIANDDLHPSEAGMQMLAKNWLTAIESNHTAH